MPPDTNSRQQAAEIAYRMANILSYRGKAEQAITLYRRAISLDPSYVPPYLELEALLRALGRGDECERLYRGAVASVPGEEVFAARLRDVLGASARSDDEQDRASAHQTKSGPDDAERRAHVVLYADCFGIGGAEQVNHAIAMGFRARGYRVTFVQPKAHHYLVQERVANGISHIWLEEDDIYRGAAESPSLCSSVSGESVFRQARADIVLFCDGCPVSSLGAKQVARDLGVPSVSLVHCVTREWATFFARYLTTLRALYRSSRQVIAVSHDNLALLHECFGLPAELGTVIHNGVAATFFEPRNRRVRSVVRAELGIPDDVIVCLTVARMELVKGYQFLVKAIRELRRRPVGTRLHFVWIGSGSMEPRIRAMIDQIGAGHQISLISRTPSVQRYLDAADMFVLPSIFEGMPVSVMEAMAKSLPVMATAISGTSEELGTTGHLLPDPAVDDARTITSLIDVLERWALDEDLRHEIGVECRRRAERMFTRDRMVADHLRVVEELLGDGSMAALAGKRTYKGARS